MKILITLFLLLILQGGGQAKQNVAYVFSVAKNISNEQKVQVKEVVTHLLMEQAKGGDTIIIFDAASRKRLVTLTLGDELSNAMGNMRQKMLKKFHRKELAALGQFLNHLQGTTNSKDKPHLLRMLHDLETLKFELPASQIKFVYLADLLVNDEKNPALSMTKGKYPADSYLKTVGLFGTKGKENLLKGIDVFLVHPGQEAFFNVQHLERVKRFYALFLEGTGAVLRSFSSSANYLKKLDSEFPPIRYEIDEIDAKGQPRTYELTEPRIIKQSSTHQGASIHTPHENLIIWQELGSGYAPPELDLNNPEIELIGMVSIGITWDANVDLDIYVRHLDDDKELSFQNTKSGRLKGIFVRDITSHPATNGFETVFYKIPVNLKRFNNPIAVNFYGGESSRAINGEIRLLFDDSIYLKKFRINARYGNKGKGNRHNNQHWLCFSIQEIIEGS